jgi:hypothetical protein
MDSLHGWKLPPQRELTRPASPGLGRVRPGPEGHPAVPCRPWAAETEQTRTLRVSGILRGAGRWSATQRPPSAPANPGAGPGPWAAETEQIRTPTSALYNICFLLLGRELLDSPWTGGRMGVSQSPAVTCVHTHTRTHTHARTHTHTHTHTHGCITESIHRCHCAPAGSHLVPIQSLVKGPKRAM